MHLLGLKYRTAFASIKKIDCTAILFTCYNDTSQKGKTDTIPNVQHSCMDWTSVPQNHILGGFRTPQASGTTERHPEKDAPWYYSCPKLKHIYPARSDALPSASSFPLLHEGNQLSSSRLWDYFSFNLCLQDNVNIDFWGCADLRHCEKFVLSSEIIWCSSYRFQGLTQK